MHMSRILRLLTAIVVSSSAVASDQASQRLFQAATSGGKLGQLKQALSDGADINVQHPSSKQTPLMASTLGGHAHMVKYLLNKGADPKIPEKDGYTPPHGAGFQGRADVVPILKEFGIDLSDRHQDGFEGIHRACWGSEQRHADTVAAFIAAGVPADRKAGNGKTPMELTQNTATKKVLAAALKTGEL